MGIENLYSCPVWFTWNLFEDMLIPCLVVQNQNWNEIGMGSASLSQPDFSLSFPITVTELQ